MSRTAVAVLVSLALALSAGPGLAKTKKKDVAAAIAAAAAVALGVSALAHDSVDYSPGKPMNTGQQKAEFEAGYRDGLANARYRANLPANTYGAGYDAGARERRLQQAGGGGPKLKGVPNKAMKGCVDQAAEAWRIRKGNVVATDARKGTAGTWLIEVVVRQAAGPVQHGRRRHQARQVHRRRESLNGLPARLSDVDLDGEAAGAGGLDDPRRDREVLQADAGAVEEGDLLGRGPARVRPVDHRADRGDRALGDQARLRRRAGSRRWSRPGRPRRRRRWPSRAAPPRPPACPWCRCPCRRDGSRARHAPPSASARSSR